MRQHVAEDDERLRRAGDPRCRPPPRGPRSTPPPPRRSPVRAPSSRRIRCRPLLLQRETARDRAASDRRPAASGRVGELEAPARPSAPASRDSGAAQAAAAGVGRPAGRAGAPSSPTAGRRAGGRPTSAQPSRETKTVSRRAVAGPQRDRQLAPAGDEALAVRGAAASTSTDAMNRAATGGDLGDGRDHRRAAPRAARSIASA